jgi:hypothetical protein
MNTKLFQGNLIKLGVKWSKYKDHHFHITNLLREISKIQQSSTNIFYNEETYFVVEWQYFQSKEWLKKKSTNVNTALEILIQINSNDFSDNILTELPWIKINTLTNPEVFLVYDPTVLINFALGQLDSSLSTVGSLSILASTPLLSERHWWLSLRR